MDKKPAVEVKNLSKRYGRDTVLKDLSFDIQKGEIFGLFGPNGAGKSTFLSVAATLSKPSAGDILINGTSVTEKPEHVKAAIGYVPQDTALYPSLSGRDNLDFWAGIYGLKGPVKKERINEAIAVARLEDRIRDKVSKYSGGMKRRLNIAISLLHHPEILLMDEPMVGVDIQSRKYITEVLTGLKKEGRTIVFTSHYADELEKLCDRIAIMDRGEIRAVGTAVELMESSGAEDLEGVLFKLTVKGDSKNTEKSNLSK